MDFTGLQTRVAEETGLDLQNADDLASINSWLNQAYQHVSSLYNWDWLFTQGTIQTVADITSGTATIAANAPVCTLSIAPVYAGSNVAVADQWMINFPSVSGDWYFVTTHAAGATSLVLSVPFISSTNLTAGSYILRKVLYSLPTDMDRLIDVRQQVSSAKLQPVDARGFDRVMPDPTATGSPLYFFFLGRDTATSPNWQIGLFPTPTSTLNLQLKYYRHITELVGATDEPLLPKNWHDVLIWGALYFYGHPFMDDDRVAIARARYEEKLADMRRNCSHVPDHSTVVQPWDTRLLMPRPRLLNNYSDSVSGI